MPSKLFSWQRRYKAHTFHGSKRIGATSNLHITRKFYVRAEDKCFWIAFVLFEKIRLQTAGANTSPHDETVSYDGLVQSLLQILSHNILRIFG